MAMNFSARIVNETYVEVRTIRLRLPTATIQQAAGVSPVWHVRLHQGSRFRGPNGPDRSFYKSWQEAATAVAGWSGDTYRLEDTNPND